MSSPSPRPTRWRGAAGGGTALLLALGAVPLVAVGVLLAGVLLFLGLFALFFLALGVLLAGAAVVLAVVTLARRPGVAGVLLSVSTLVVVAATALGAAAFTAYVGDPDAPGRGAGAVASAAMDAADDGDAAQLCRYLVAAARGPRCERGTLCAGESCGYPVIVFQDDAVVAGDRARQRWSGDSFGAHAVPDGDHWVRLQQVDGRWRLLDVPGLVDRCVDRAVRRGQDPFGCPVRAR